MKNIKEKVLKEKEQELNYLLNWVFGLSAFNSLIAIVFVILYFTK